MENTLKIKVFRKSILFCKYLRNESLDLYEILCGGQYLSYELKFQISLRSMHKYACTSCKKERARYIVNVHVYLIPFWTMFPLIYLDKKFGVSCFPLFIIRQTCSGAKLRWKPNGTKTTTPRGKTESGREYFRVCDLGMKGKKLTQPSITSAMMTPGRRQEDTSSNLCTFHL